MCAFGSNYQILILISNLESLQVWLPTKKFPVHLDNFYFPLWISECLHIFFLLNTPHGTCPFALSPMLILPYKTLSFSPSSWNAKTTAVRKQTFTTMSNGPLANSHSPLLFLKPSQSCQDHVFLKIIYYTSYFLLPITSDTKYSYFFVSLCPPLSVHVYVSIYF